MLLGMSLGVAREEFDSRLEKIAQRIVDRNISQWSSPRLPWTERSLMPLCAVIDPKQDHGLQRRIDSGVNMGRTGT
jgi:hypothetical protein